MIYDTRENDQYSGKQIIIYKNILQLYRQFYRRDIMQNININTASEEIITIDDQQYVTFLIDEETYGIAVGKVKEIIGMIEITHVPNTAYFMEGVINLRGIVVPVLDMRKKFQMEPKKYDTNTVIIIVELGGKLIGLIVDSVSDVLNIPANSIQTTPNFNSKIETDFIRGIGQIENSMIIILDSDKILSTEEIKTVDSVNDAP